MRNSPNIIITGTPGVGKTTTCEQLVSLSSATSSPLHHLSINTLVKNRSCHEGYDEGLQTYIVDEDKLLDEVEKEIGAGGGEGEGDGEGGWLIDWHACDLFPKSWVDLVVVLRCERTDVLWDRLKARYVMFGGTGGLREEAERELN
jgi:adenylate kinase